SDQQEIRKLLSQQSIANRAVHLGKIPFADLQSLLAHATAFLMPNIPQQGDMEGFGLVCLEASLSGTLVLASNLEGIKDAIVDQKNGLLLPWGNPQAWIEQLQEIRQRPEDYKEKAQAYQAFTLQEYSWDKMVEEYMQVFNNM
ncbi:MAG: glycosyltransferase family 4 protein, partial [Sphingobacterium sp.]